MSSEGRRSVGIAPPSILNAPTGGTNDVLGAEGGAGVEEEEEEVVEEEIEVEVEDDDGTEVFVVGVTLG